MIARTLATLAAAGMVATLAPPVAADAPRASGCQAIVHRANTATHDEETAPAIAQLGGAGHWVELDTRLTAGRPQVLVHDKSLGRIATPAQNQPVVERTLADIQGVTLDHGEHVLSTEQGINAVKNAGTSSLIELKQWAAFKTRWRADGFGDLHDWIVGAGMTSRVWVGGQSTRTGADIADFHARYPDVQVFWRTNPGDVVTPATAQARGATLVELHPSHWQPWRVAALKAAGIRVGTRTIINQSLFNQAYDVGIRTFQTNSGPDIRAWCAAR